MHPRTIIGLNAMVLSMVTIFQRVQITVAGATIVIINIVIFSPVVKDFFVEAVEMSSILSVKTKIIKELIESRYLSKGVQVDLNFLLEFLVVERFSFSFFFVRKGHLIANGHFVNFRVDSQFPKHEDQFVYFIVLTWFLPTRITKTNFDSVGIRIFFPIIFNGIYGCFGMATNGEKMTRAIDTQRWPISVQHGRIIIPRSRRRRIPVVVRNPGFLNNMDLRIVRYRTI